MVPYQLLTLIVTLKFAWRGGVTFTIHIHDDAQDLLVKSDEDG